MCFLKINQVQFFLQIIEILCKFVLNCKTGFFGPGWSLLPRFGYLQNCVKLHNIVQNCKYQNC